MMFVAAAATLAVAGGVGSAGAYDALAWRALEGGGTAFVSAGGYVLGGTIGQHDAGTLAAAAYALQGGFWIGGAPGWVDVPQVPPLVRPFRFLPTRPNPVLGHSLAAFDLPRASRVTLALFDVSGRAVRRWDLGLLPAGHQEREWSAVDGGGRWLASGVYFLRLDTAREWAVNKVLVLR
ncbi:MAG: hypothetical protein IT347_12240 [Candidatus Eisenbacteria bacterium]|nr:hypothetical protein [Candidatus Eisenbacteria bacterium]